MIGVSRLGASSTEYISAKSNLAVARLIISGQTCHASRNSACRNEVSTGAVSTSSSAEGGAACAQANSKSAMRLVRRNDREGGNMAHILAILLHRALQVIGTISTGRQVRRAHAPDRRRKARR